jgi:guanylate kinase
MTGGVAESQSQGGNHGQEYAFVTAKEFDKIVNPAVMVGRTRAGQ